jgi:signal transduction histidine kinase
VADPVLVALLTVAEVIVVALVAANRHGLNGVQRAILFGLTPLLPVPLLIRRRFPGPALVALAVLTAVIWLADADATTAVTGSLGLYSLGRLEDSKRSLRWWFIVLAILVPAGLTSALIYPGEEMWFEFASRCGVLLGLYWIGVSFRSKAEVADALRARALQTEQDAFAERERAVLAERSRIAAEMHDVISHSVTVMVVQSDVANRLAGSDPIAARRSMEHVSSTGRAALAELRSMLQVLGHATEGQPERHPQPNATTIPLLIDSFRSAGMKIDTSHRSAADSDAGADTDRAYLERLPASISRCTYRVVQEALTNAMKHAPGSNVSVQFTIHPEHLSVSVTNDRGTDSHSSRPVHAPGFGLIGMAERVRGVSGQLRHGPTPDGGYGVIARMPLHAAP